jgi:dihydroxyacid dehydratase/phosphogluconate dehydratase
LEGPARVFTREREAISAIKAGHIRAGDVLVLAGVGPMGTGMEETYQLTSALKHLPFGKYVALITDARFSGVSTGACIGHVGPEALAGGPIGRLRDGDRIRVRVDCRNLEGSLDLVGDAEGLWEPGRAEHELSSRTPHPGLAPHEKLPADTRLWAALVGASGGTWGGCVYDVDSIVAALERAH